MYSMEFLEENIEDWFAEEIKDKLLDKKRIIYKI